MPIQKRKEKHILDNEKGTVKVKEDETLYYNTWSLSFKQKRRFVRAYLNMLDKGLDVEIDSTWYLLHSSEYYLLFNVEDFIEYEKNKK